VHSHAKRGNVQNAPPSAARQIGLPWPSFGGVGAQLTEASDHHPVTAVLQRQDHLGQALELLPEPIAQLRPVNLVQRRLAEGFALEYQGQVSDPALDSEDVVVGATPYR
jgi:hypothetical protein